MSSMNNMNGYQDQDQYKKRYQEKMAEREEKKLGRESGVLKLKRMKALKKASYWLIALLILLGIGWLLVARSSPKGPDLSVQVEDIGRQHIQDGGTFSEYSSNPPTSGPHYSNPAVAKFYKQELPDGQMIHNLEHGNIWISFNPEISEENVKKLKRLSAGNVIVTPRPSNDTDVAVAAWERLDKFNIENDILDTQRIRDFILRYQNQGPEKINSINSR